MPALAERLLHDCGRVEDVSANHEMSSFVRNAVVLEVAVQRRTGISRPVIKAQGKGAVGGLIQIAVVMAFISEGTDGRILTGLVVGVRGVSVVLGRDGDVGKGDLAESCEPCRGDAAGLWG